MTTRTATLIDLLGDTRAGIVECLRRAPQSVADLARGLGLSQVAVRRHLQVLERDGLVDAETVRTPGPGRPALRYTLTERAAGLFPDHSAAFANELLEFLENEHGRAAVLAFLRWRNARQESRYGASMALAGATDPAARAGLLAELLDADGFMAETTSEAGSDGATVVQLRQGHCAVKELAAAHPEICAYEAAMFKDLLGAHVSRRQTIATGADACVCTVTVPESAAIPLPLIDNDDRPNPGAHHGDES